LVLRRGNGAIDRDRIDGNARGHVGLENRVDDGIDPQWHADGEQVGGRYVRIRHDRRAVENDLADLAANVSRSGKKPRIA